MAILFLLFLGFIIVYFFRGGNSQYSTPQYESQQNKKSNNTYNDKILYKTKGIRSFEMRGMYFRNLSVNESGGFIGFVECDNNPHDQYAVAIVNNENTHLGFIPKGNKRLHDSIMEWHQGKVFAYGSLYKDDYYDKWHGTVFVPVGFSEDEIQKIEIFQKLIYNRNYLLAKKEIRTSEYFEIFDNQLEIIALSEKMKKSDSNYDLPVKTLNSFSKQLENEKSWEGLVQLEKYSEILKQPTTSFQDVILRRIENAKMKLKKE